jgi:solute carrier family 8 (sodium/calcium exchanger)
MALGSSAPEILLSIIEILGNGFEAGDLGPNTIVGSAAYNLFVIIGYCVLIVPKGENRRIKHLRVFFVTASWSVFAYIWLYVIIAQSSPGVIEVWEGLITFLFFPITVLTAYGADQKIFVGNFLEKKIKASTIHRDSEVGSVEEGHRLSILENGGMKKDNSDLHQSDNSSEIRLFEDHRRDYINILHEMRIKNPGVGIDELQRLAEVEILKRGPKSRAYYRIQATRKLIGGSNNVKKKVIENEKRDLAKSKSNLETALETNVSDQMTEIFFDPPHYTCFESVGSLEVYVSRRGGDLGRTILVDYRTENGTAEAVTDFEYAEGTIVFLPLETHKTIVIKIIDDDVYEEDEHFYIRLFNQRYLESNKADEARCDFATLTIAHPDLATVMILDDDHGGVFVFPDETVECIENCQTLRVKVLRTSGARGKVKIPYKTVDGTSIAGKDYGAVEDVLTFYNNEIE